MNSSAESDLNGILGEEAVDNVKQTLSTDEIEDLREISVHDRDNGNYFDMI